jgi:transposase
MLEYVRGCFKVIRHVRPELSCDACDHIVQAPSQSRPIDRGLAGPGLLAHVLVSKYADHLPLYRKSESYARRCRSRPLHAGWMGWSHQRSARPARRSEEAPPMSVERPAGTGQTSAQRPAYLA